MRLIPTLTLGSLVLALTGYALAQVGGSGSASYQVSEFGPDTTAITLAAIPSGATKVTLELTLTLEEYVSIINAPGPGQGFLSWVTDDGSGNPLPCTLDGGAAFGTLVAECDSSNGYGWDLDAGEASYVATTPGRKTIKKNIAPWSSPLSVTFDFLQAASPYTVTPTSAQVYISPLQVADLTVIWQ